MATTGGRPNKLSDDAFLALYVRCGGNLTTMESQLTDTSYRTLQRMKTRLEGKIASLESETKIVREELKPIDVFSEIPEIKEWKAWMELNGISEAYQTSQLNNLRWSWELMNHLRPLSVTSDDVKRARVEHRKTHAEGSEFHITVAWRSFFTYLSERKETPQAIKDRIREESIMHKGATKRLKSKNLHCTDNDYLTREEYASLHAVLEHEDLAFHTACDFAKETGTRMGGIDHLRACDVNFGSGMVETLEKGAHKWQKYPTDHTLALLRRLIMEKGLNGEDRLFPEAVNTYNLRLKEVAEIAGVKKRLYWHKFRHTFATWALHSLGADAIKEICLRGGWEDAGTFLKFYVTPNPKSLADLRRVVSLEYAPS